MSVRIIATGGHSGLGFEALKALLAWPALASGCNLTLLVRDQHAAHVVHACQTLMQQFAAARSTVRSAMDTDPHLSIETLPLDLTRLSSVRKAASLLKDELHSAQASSKGLDIFLLNAAVAKSSRETVMDDDRASGSVDYAPDHLVSGDNRIETTACANHVAHLLLISSLVPTIVDNAKKGRKTRIVFTGSALHRSVKDTADLDNLFSSSSNHSSFDSSTHWTLRESYAASKFLQMLGVRAFRRRLEAALESASVPTGKVEVVVVQPGFVPQTALCRESGLLTRFAMSYLLPWAPFATSADAAGRYIANACTTDLSAEESGAEEGTQESGEFHSQTSRVRSALLEVHAKKQRFGTLDPRTADIELQEKWWPAACNHV